MKNINDYFEDLDFSDFKFEVIDEKALIKAIIISAACLFVVLAALIFIVV